MSNSKAKKKDLRKMVGLSIFTAIIVVITIICTFIRFGPFSITLALAPIVIGSAVYGKWSGAYLGFVFGLVVLLTGIFGWDGGTVIYLMSINPLACIGICLVKGAAAGLCAGLVYSALEIKNMHLAVIAAAVVCPVVNTLLFVIGMSLFFFSTLESWASGQAMVYFIIIGFFGFNFIIELLVNLVLSSGITSVIKASKKGVL